MGNTYRVLNQRQTISHMCGNSNIFADQIEDKIGGYEIEFMEKLSHFASLNGVDGLINRRIESVEDNPNKYPATTFGYLLRTLSNHLTSGSKYETKWISTTPEFIYGLHCYASFLEPEKYFRNKMAVIKSHDKMEFDISGIDIFENEKINVENVKKVFMKDIKEINKLCINFDDEKLIDELDNHRLINCMNGTSIKKTTGYNFAKDVREVVVYKEILEDDVVAVLEGIEIDISYSVAMANIATYDHITSDNKDKKIGVTRDKLDDVILDYILKNRLRYNYDNPNKFYKPNNLTEEEQIFYHEHYEKGKNIWYIIDELYYESEDNIYIEKVREVLNIKRNVMNKVINQAKNKALEKAERLIEASKAEQYKHRTKVGLIALSKTLSTLFGCIEDQNLKLLEVNADLSEQIKEHEEEKDKKREAYLEERKVLKKEYYH